MTPVAGGEIVPESELVMSLSRVVRAEVQFRHSLALRMEDHLQEHGLQTPPWLRSIIALGGAAPAPLPDDGADDAEDLAPVACAADVQAVGVRGADAC